MKVNNAGIQLIKTFEGCLLNAYKCSAGVPTIGYGSTFYQDGRKVKIGDKITQKQAEDLLEHTLSYFAKDVESLIKVNLNENQFSALVSFAFNTGSDIDSDTIPEGLGDSTLLKKVNKNPNDPTIRNEFLKWVNARGKRLSGLVRRRNAEANLYFEKC